MRQIRSWPRRLRCIAGGSALAVAALAPSACSTTHILSNNSVSACYRAIPVAKAAVHDSGATMVAVHRLPVDKVRPHLPLSSLAILAGDDDTVVCAVIFKGNFAPGQVDLAPVTEEGDYAVVLLTSRHLHLLLSGVLNTLPKSLGKRTV